VTRVPAILHGVGDNDKFGGMCTLQLWTEQSSRGRSFIRCRITDAPTELPDGSYRLEFEGCRLTTQKRDGQWELSFLLPSALTRRSNSPSDTNAA
jgi:hypothetical protein